MINQPAQPAQPVAQPVAAAQPVAGAPPATTPVAAQPVTDVNTTEARPEPVVDWPDQGTDLPTQMGGARSTLMPGISNFLLPLALTALWHDIEATDRRPFLPSGQPNPTKGTKFKRRMLKFDRNTPLVVHGGPHDGEPMTATFSTHPRQRGKTDDPKTAWISDAAYLLDLALNDKSRPADPKLLEATINKYPGKVIRLEHGLSGQCRPDRVRYIRVTTSEGESDLQDPTGQKGCGRRYYTRDFKDAETGAYDTEIACDCGTPSAEDVAAGTQPALVVIRGFENVERILTPQGA